MGPQLLLGGWRAAFTGRLRRDNLGSARSGSWLAPDELCPECNARTIAPYSNGSVAAALRVSGPVRWQVRPGASARWEQRHYDQPQFTERQGPFGIQHLDRRLRHDQRVGAGASLALRLSRAWTLAARYDHSRVSSSFDPLPGGCPPGQACPTAPPSPRPTARATGSTG